MTYHITLQTPDLISIVFDGIMGFENVAPNQFFRTITFDPNTLQSFVIANFIAVDSEFADKIWSSERVFDSAWQPLHVSNIIKGDWPKERIVDSFDKWPLQRNFYVTEDSIVVNLSMPTRTYVWVEVPLGG